MLAKAILVHGVIGYKFCWLLLEDQNQGTPAGYMNNFGLWAQVSRFYEQRKVVVDMKNFGMWV